MKDYRIAGFISSFLFSIMLLPEVYNIYTNKSSHISIVFISIFLIASMLMLYYGYKMKSIPIMISNFSNSIIDNTSSGSGADVDAVSFRESNSNNDETITIDNLTVSDVAADVFDMVLPVELVSFLEKKSKTLSPMLMPSISKSLISSALTGT